MSRVIQIIVRLGDVQNLNIVGVILSETHNTNRITIKSETPAKISFSRSTRYHNCYHT